MVRFCKLRARADVDLKHQEMVTTSLCSARFHSAAMKNAGLQERNRRRRSISPGKTFGALRASWMKHVLRFPLLGVCLEARFLVQKAWLGFLACAGVKNPSAAPDRV